MRGSMQNFSPIRQIFILGPGLTLKILYNYIIGRIYKGPLTGKVFGSPTMRLGCFQIAYDDEKQHTKSRPNPTYNFALGPRRILKILYKCIIVWIYKAIKENMNTMLVTSSALSVCAETMDHTTGTEPK